MEILEQIKRLKREKDATIIAHYYQPIEIQQIADYIGDSLGLAKMASEKVTTKHLVFAGVKFMGETAVVLNPEKKTFLPDMTAGCPLADFLSAQTIKEYKQQYPNAPVVVYVNTTAETKTEADLCCTSSNALKMIQKIAEQTGSQTILFGPDKNLAEYVRRQTNYNIITIPGKGCCPRHNMLQLETLQKLQSNHPNAITLVHPECLPAIQDHADFIGSTAGMLNYVVDHPENDEFIIGTEVGLVDHLRWKLPQHTYYPADANMICKNMKKNTLQKVLKVLEAIGDPNLEEQYRIVVPPNIADRALRSIETMIKFSS